MLREKIKNHKPELLLAAAALVIFAVIWGSDYFRKEPVRVFVPMTVSTETAPAATDVIENGSDGGNTTSAASAPTNSGDEPVYVPPRPSTIIAETRRSTTTTTAAPIATLPPAQQQTQASPTQTQTQSQMQTTTTRQNTAQYVNVNTADVNALQALPGIGGVKAQAIVDYRKQHGRFLSPEDLLKVKGIGPATLAKMRSMLVF